MTWTGSASPFWVSFLQWILSVWWWWFIDCSVLKHTERKRGVWFSPSAWRQSTAGLSSESNASSGLLTWVLNWSTSPGVCSHGGKAAVDDEINRVLWSELMWVGRQNQVWKQLQRRVPCCSVALSLPASAALWGNLLTPRPMAGVQPVRPSVSLCGVSTRLAFLLLALSLWDEEPDR